MPLFTPLKFATQIEKNIYEACQADQNRTQEPIVIHRLIDLINQKVTLQLIYREQQGDCALSLKNNEANKPSIFQIVMTFSNGSKQHFFVILKTLDDLMSESQKIAREFLKNGYRDALDCLPKPELTTTEEPISPTNESVKAAVEPTESAVKPKKRTKPLATVTESTENATETAATASAPAESASEPLSAVAESIDNNAETDA
jgi:hypothetical protein